MGLLDSVKIKNNSCVGVLKALLSSYEPKVEEPIVGESKDWTDDKKKGGESSTLNELGDRFPMGY